MAAINYTTPSAIAGVTYSETTFQLILDFASNAYVIEKFKDDPFLEGLTIERQRLIFSIINNQALFEYSNQYSAELKNTASSNGNLMGLIYLITTAICLLLV